MQNVILFNGKKYQAFGGSPRDGDLTFYRTYSGSLNVFEHNSGMGMPFADIVLKEVVEETEIKQQEEKVKLVPVSLRLKANDVIQNKYNGNRHVILAVLRDDMAAAVMIADYASTGHISQAGNKSYGAIRIVCYPELERDFELVSDSAVSVSHCTCRPTPPDRF